MPSVDQDEYMDKAYEEALQYLCIHLREDQLPIGFDGGGTLDVLSPTTGNNKGEKKQNDGALDKKEQRGDEANGGYDINILQFAEYFGLTPKEAFAIQSSNKSSFIFSSTCDELALKRAF